MIRSRVCVFVCVFWFVLQAAQLAAQLEADRPFLPSCLSGRHLSASEIIQNKNKQLLGRVRSCVMFKSMKFQPAEKR